MAAESSILPIKMTPRGTFLGKRFIPLTDEQFFIEKTWMGFLDETLGPEMGREEMEALERALKKFKGISFQKLENPYFWESWAPTWAEYSRRNLTRSLLLLNRLARIVAHQKIVSLGAGSCWQEIFLARHGCPKGRVLGLDFSRHMIKQGAILSRKIKIKNIYFTVGKVEQLPLLENAGDLVISINLLDLVPDASMVLKEIKGILAGQKKGRYFFVFPLNPRARLQTQAANWKFRLIQAGLDRPKLFCLSTKNYKGESLRLLGLTNIDPVGWVD